MWDEIQTVVTPIFPSTRLVKEDFSDIPNPILQRRYCGIIRSIGYLVQTMRCDMAFAYGQLCLFLHHPDPVHMTAPERTLVSVRDTHDQGLSYCDPGADHRNVLKGWVDSDFAADSQHTPQRHRIHRIPQQYSYQLAQLQTRTLGGVKLSSVKLNPLLPAPSPLARKCLPVPSSIRL